MVANKNVPEPIQISPEEMEKWRNDLADAVRPAIRELELQRARDMARAPFIVVSNGTQKKDL